LPCGITQDDDSYSLTHSRENLMSPSDDSDTFSPVDNMLHVTNNNLDKQQGNIIMIFIILSYVNCVVFNHKLQYQWRVIK